MINTFKIKRIAAKLVAPCLLLAPYLLVASLSLRGRSMSSDSSASAAPVITIYAYTSDGTNTGTVRLGRSAHLTSSVSGTTQRGVNWSISGAGSISSAGIYQAPPTMPTDTVVRARATLADNSSISASYQFSLIYPQPSFYSVYTTTGPLTSGASTVVTISGAGFVPRSTLLVNGSPAAVRYISPNELTANIAIPPGMQGSYAFAVQDPSPGGDTTPPRSLNIRPLSMSVTALSPAGGINPGSLRVGLQTQFAASVSGSGSALTLTWSVSGGGTISASGLYTAPATMPPAGKVTVTASLAANRSIHGSYQLSLENPEPVIGYTTPTQVSAGSTTVVTVNGRGFVSGTTLQANGVEVPVTVHSAHQLSATITVPAGREAGMPLVAANPNPGGSVSQAFTLPCGKGGYVLANVSTDPGRQIPDDFFGLSYEWGDQKWFMGTPTQGMNPIYRQMLTNLMQGHSKPMWIRIGGQSSDESGEPTGSTLASYISLAKEMRLKFSLGVNMASSDIQLTKNQAKYFAENMPAGSLAAIEIGNEADNYHSWGARPNTYTMEDFLQEFATYGDAVASVIPPSIGLMGPSLADPKNVKAYFAQFVEEEKHISVATVHGYVGDVGTQKTLTTEWFLGENVATWWPSQYAPDISEAHNAGELLRIAEINSVDEGGLNGVSNTMGIALWAVDTMFEYVKVGADGVNWHGSSACPYCPFTFGDYYWANKDSFTLQYVNPLYYGFLLFQSASQNGARMLPVTLDASANVKVWATKDNDSVVRVIILNKDLNFSGDVAVSVPGFTTASVQRLTAPSYTAEKGITLEGQSFDGSLDGTLVGSALSEETTLHGGVFNMAVQPASAILMTLKP